MSAWLPIVGALIGLVATALGWSLNQLGQWFVFRHERKKAMARVIYGMLQIRDRIRMLPETVRILGEKLNIPAADQIVLVAVFENFFLAEDGFATEFEASIAVLAQYDPVLAARMRGKNQVVPLLRKLRQMIVANPMAAMLWSTIEGQIMTHGLPRFDESILEIGRLHSRKMQKDIEGELRKKVDLPGEVVATLTAAIQQQMQIQQQQTAQLTHQKYQPPQNRVPIWASRLKDS